MEQVSKLGAFKNLNVQLTPHTNELRISGDGTGISIFEDPKVVPVGFIISSVAWYSALYGTGSLGSGTGPATSKPGYITDWVAISSSIKR